MQADLQPSETEPNAGRFAEACQPLRDSRFTPASHWPERRHRQELFERFALTFERLGNLKGKRGLDVGCGSGQFVLEALRRGATHMVGIDPGPGALELLRQQVETLGQVDRLELLHGYFPALKPSGTFDFAMVIGVLDYVDDPLPFLQALRDIVHGTSIVTFPSRHWLLTPLRQLSHWSRGSRVHFYDEPKIGSVCQQAGFRSIDVVKIDGAGLDFHVCLTT